MRRTQWPQRLQWCDLFGLIMLHLLHISQLSLSEMTRQTKLKTKQLNRKLIFNIETHTKTNCNSSFSKERKKKKKGLHCHLVVFRENFYFLLFSVWICRKTTSLNNFNNLKEKKRKIDNDKERQRKREKMYRTRAGC